MFVSLHTLFFPLDTFLLSFVLSTWYLECTTLGCGIDFILHWVSAQLLPIQGYLPFALGLKWQLHLHSPSHHSFFNFHHGTFLIFSESEFLVHLFLSYMCRPWLTSKYHDTGAWTVSVTAVFYGLESSLVCNRCLLNIWWIDEIINEQTNFSH